jgi:hypothetical protein
LLSKDSAYIKPLLRNKQPILRLHYFAYILEYIPVSCAPVILNSPHF